MAKGRVLIIALSCFVLGRAAPARGDDETYALLTVFAKALHFVASGYVEPIAPSELIRAALRGVVARLDSHSAYLDPAEVAAIDREAAEREGDVGLVLTPLGCTERCAIELVVPGGPAERVGIAVGDVVISMNGRPARELALRGPVGTALALELERDGKGPRKVMVTRERSPDAGVLWRTMTGKNGKPIGYLSIGRFADGTEQKVRKGLEALGRKRTLAGLVLDLRGNPGGLLSEAVRVADLWLESGVIVTTEGRDRGRVVERAHPKGTEANYPILVLVDGKTASAAEALAAALAQNRRARLLGTKTYGKGSVQTLMELDDHSLLRLTVARYLPPSGISIEGVGLTPELVVEDPDQQLRAALASFL